MKYIGDRDYNIRYKKRSGAYAILQRKGDNKIGIVTDGDFFFLGGGIEDNETEIEALKREAVEESGYTLKNIRYFDKVYSWINDEIRNRYLDNTATVYLAELDEKITEPIEKDHRILWVNAIEFENKMYDEWQRYIIKEYMEKINGLFNKKL